MMSNLTRWDPFRQLEEVHNRLSDIFDRSSAQRGESRDAAEWSPVVDIVEDDKEYVIKAELPEVKKDEVHVAVENGVLQISGERKLEKETKGRRYHRIERSYGSFVRGFVLPDDADAERVSAEFSDGVLRVRVAKAEAARPKLIPVN